MGRSKGEQALKNSAAGGVVGFQRLPELAERKPPLPGCLLHCFVQLLQIGSLAKGHDQLVVVIRVRQAECLALEYLANVAECLGINVGAVRDQVEREYPAGSQRLIAVFKESCPGKPGW